jgi:hypothetical protein
MMRDEWKRSNSCVTRSVFIGWLKAKSHEPAWQLEYSVEWDAIAWSYWTNIDNWADPPARFTLDGAFAAGSQGTTWMPGKLSKYCVAEIGLYRLAGS